MIETKILGDAVGIQRGDVIDNSETTVLPSLANGVITGHFKRGRMDKPFKVMASNYQALLGYDPSNPSYLAVEDAFKRGISEISVFRVGGVLGRVYSVPPTGLILAELIPLDYILRYDFNGDILDKSGNVNNGTSSGSVSFIAGRKSGTQALRFTNGNVTTSASLTNSLQLSLSCWILTSQLGGAGVFSTPPSNQFSLMLDNRSPNTYELYDGISTDYLAANRSSDNGAWTHLVLQYDRNSMGKYAIYVNGALSVSKDRSGNVGAFSNVPLQFGMYNNSLPFVGSLQDIRVYNRMLNQGEITALFNE